jgi:hypothetical protein
MAAVHREELFQRLNAVMGVASASFSAAPPQQLHNEFATWLDTYDEKVLHQPSIVKHGRCSCAVLLPAASKAMQHIILRSFQASLVSLHLLSPSVCCCVSPCRAAG